MDATSNRQQQQQQQQQHRKTSGRQKIEIKKVEKESNRYVTFSKRKNGLFKKATELSTLCGAQIAILLFSEHDKVYSCGHPDVDKVLDRYIAETDHDQADDNAFMLLIDNDKDHEAQKSSSVVEEEQEYKKSVAGLEEEKRVAKMLEINMRNNNNNEAFLWDLAIDNMGEEELEAYKESMQELRKNVVARLEMMAANNAATESRIINQFINQNAAAPYGNNIGFM